MRGMEIPAEFINAAMFVHAEAKEQVQDGFARFITTGEWESMASKGKLESVTKYNTVIMRAMETLRHCVS